MKPRQRYVSVRMALNQRVQDMGKWETQSATLVFGGNGKRYHRENTCYTATADGRVRVCPSKESHVFSPRPAITYNDHIFGQTPKSHPHLLPWLDDTTHLPDGKLITDLLWIDPDTIDPEDLEWLSTLL